MLLTGFRIVAEHNTRLVHPIRKPVVNGRSVKRRHRFFGSPEDFGCETCICLFDRHDAVRLASFAFIFVVHPRTGGHHKSTIANRQRCRRTVTTDFVSKSPQQFASGRIVAINAAR